MKSTMFSPTALATFAICTLSMTGFAQADLVVGWNSFATGDRVGNEAPEDFAAGVTGALGTSVNPGGAMQGGGLRGDATANFAGNTTYGSSELIVNLGSDSGVLVNSFSNNNRFIDFSVTNNSGSDLTLEGIHFDAGMAFNNGGTDIRQVQVSHFSNVSDLNDAFSNRNLGSSGDIAAGNFNFVDYDIDLTASGHADLVLGDTETAAFRIFIDDNSDAGVNEYGFRIDNIGISGSFAAIPEPSSALLFGSIGMGILLRRKRA
ncbi:MAG: PEP-CTERM sorting domain-containing protein [Planctomycetota bacterium]